MIGIFLIVILISGWVPKKLQRNQGKISKAWIEFTDAAKELKKKKNKIFLCFFQSLLFQILVAFVIEAILMGLGGPPLELANLFLITSASSVLAMIPLGLNGYGMREGAYIYLLSPFGYSSSQAVTISILFAFFVTIYSLVGGINWFLIHKQSEKIQQIS